jgi:pyruvate-ferredoxin/flavodoxin oxidoreductase
VLKIRLFRRSRSGFRLRAAKTVKTLAVPTAPRSRAPWASRSIRTWSTRWSKKAASTARCPKSSAAATAFPSKEFTPAMVKAVFDELKKPQPKNHFTVGINDDVSRTSLEYDLAFSTESDKSSAPCSTASGRRHGGRQQELDQDHREDTPNFAQGYFVYDSKKSGSITVSHLRFGPERSAPRT